MVQRGWIWAGLGIIGAIGGASIGEARAPSLRIMLLNGGMSPKKNYESHLVHIEKMRDVLVERGFHAETMDVFMSDGGNTARDLAVRDPVPEDRGWLLEDTDGEALLPRVQVVNTPWDGPQAAATREGLGRWFADVPLRSGDTLFMYVTDHGYRDQQTAQSGLYLWEEQLTPGELQAMLGGLDDGVQTVMVMSQCYSGAFAAVAWADGAPTGDVCGFFSTNALRPAYGCYPEGRSKSLGHGFRFIDALGGAETLDQANDWVRLADQSPDVPLATSDLYLEHLIQQAAGDQAIADFADRLLDGAAARPDWSQTQARLDAIAQAFGMTAPERLADLDRLQDQLDALNDELGDAADRWTQVRQQAARDNLEGLPGWSARVEDIPARPKRRAEARDALLTDLAQTPQFAVVSALHDNEERADDVLWRLKVRESVLLRMRAVMLRAAGQELIRQEKMGAARRGLKRLARCEATPVGAPARDEMPPLPPPYPTLAAEAATIASVKPSFLGIRFEPVAHDAAPGAVRVKAVSPDSPAARAGIQTGDVLTGAPGAPFQTPYHITAWVALSQRTAPVTLEGQRGEQAMTFAVQLATPDEG